MKCTGYRGLTVEVSYVGFILTAGIAADAGRFVTGVASGAITLFTPRYIAETAPSRIRGAVGSLSQVTAARFQGLGFSQANAAQF